MKKKKSKFKKQIKSNLIKLNLKYEIKSNQNKYGKTTN